MATLDPTKSKGTPALAARTPRRPPAPRWTGPIWKAGRLLSVGRASMFLRVRSAAALPPAVRARFRAMGLPEEDTLSTLRSVHSLSEWPELWTQTAQRFLGEARREDHAGHRGEAAAARRQAALCYHVASLIGVEDQRTARTLRASAAGLFSQTIAALTPTARRVTVNWRTAELPGYLVTPALQTNGSPLVVMLNGTTTTKEELLLWSRRFLDHGISVLAIDWPGTGEASNLPVTVDCDDLTDGILEFAAAEPAIDQARVALVGFSLGGAIAIRAAANNWRIAACAVVTPPYDPTRWLDRVNPIVWEQLVALAGDDVAVRQLAATMALPEAAARLRCPLLIFGAGHDLVIPPGESLHLAARVGDLATLIWHPHLGHGLYEIVNQWTNDTARWLSAIFDLPPDANLISTRVDHADSREDRTSPFQLSPDSSDPPAVGDVPM